MKSWKHYWMTYLILNMVLRDASASKNCMYVCRIGFQEIKICPFSHFSSWENVFSEVKSGFWGHISHLLGLCLYSEVVLDFRFGRRKCPNREWGEGHFHLLMWLQCKLRKTILFVVSIEGALRLPATYDNHPNPIHKKD